MARKMIAWEKAPQSRPPAKPSQKVSKSQKASKMFGWPLQVWENVMVTSLVVAALAAVLLVIAAYSVVQLQRKEIQSAARDAAEYKSKMELETAKAKTEQEQLKSQLAWRRISEDEANKVVGALRDKKFTVQLTWPSGDPEAQVYAADIAGMLRKAGLTVTPAILSETAPFGIVISGPQDLAAPSAEWQALANAFKDAGLRLFVSRQPQAALAITVGVKPPNF
jgi:hypothetical protein